MGILFLLIVKIVNTEFLCATCVFSCNQYHIGAVYNLHQFYCNKVEFKCLLGIPRYIYGSTINMVNV